ncbi:methanethiol S-methyltransferase [Paramicrobacterium fandaimingii]|uniref:methanethiol S-methyltransferase n=1 Tax=Paramicrobacterium fandaimingii TaxID=2708079 RepID=UPI0014200B51|nr:methanethiol S-methyltransferase [Microbacterium fandaimingii]
MRAPTRRLRFDTTGRVLGLVYGIVVYTAFIAVFAYSIAFIENASIEVAGIQVVPRTVDDGGPMTPGVLSVVIDALLLSLFAIQHSVMARSTFKVWWTRFVPAPLERSTYVLLATACLAALMWWWHPIRVVVWDVNNDIAHSVLILVSLCGWLIVLLSTFLIDHFDLFGLRQVVANARRQSQTSPQFVIPFWYRLVRHPIYVGFLIAFWAAPVMTTGHLLFAGASTVYIVIGIQLEERDLVAAFGDDYVSYRNRVPMLIPGRRRRRGDRTNTAELRGGTIKR